MYQILVCLHLQNHASLITLRHCHCSALLAITVSEKVNAYSERQCCLNFQSRNYQSSRSTPYRFQFIICLRQPPHTAVHAKRSFKDRYTTVLYQQFSCTLSYWNSCSQALSTCSVHHSCRIHTRKATCAHADYGMWTAMVAVLVSHAICMLP